MCSNSHCTVDVGPHPKSSPTSFNQPICGSMEIDASPKPVGMSHAFTGSEIPLAAGSAGRELPSGLGLGAVDAYRDMAKGLNAALNCRACGLRGVVRARENCREEVGEERD